MRRLTPSQVLDLQGLVKAQLSQEKPRQYVRLVAESMYSQGDPDWSKQNGGPTPGGKIQNGDAIASHIEGLLGGAHTFHVQAEMVDLIVAAAMSLDDTTPWRLSLLPTGVGFVYFDKPIITQDVRGRKLKAHAVLWGPAQTSMGPSTALYWLNDIEDPDDVITAKAKSLGMEIEELREFGRLQVFHIDFIANDQRIGPQQIPVPEDYDFGRMGLEEGETPTPADNGIRLFVAYLRLLSQTLVKSSPADVDRAAMKRATRRRLPGLVTTVTLRRVQYVGNETHDETEVEWSHRWLVRGHWRRQPCGPDHPLAEPDGHGEFVAIIYINPYIKGPEDKPLHLSNKVYDLAR